MPPVRTMTAAKPVKTERTHEENQERAYIAASRRSDRSLEARVESARRASEIHKRRTGRSLRVTEQDVVNEEMYEEEDDDLPMQYRRLTAHLQTTNADFDRRLAAYLTNHVAMRTALGQAVSDTWANNQPYPNAPQFANPMQQQFPQGSFPNPMLPPQQNMQPQQQQQRSPTNYRQSPYPMPNQHRPNPHGRSASQDIHGYPAYAMQSPVEVKAEHRRMSMPAAPNAPTPTQTNLAMTPQSMVSPAHASPVLSRNSSSSNIANLKHEAMKAKSASPSRESVHPQQQPTPAPQAQGQTKVPAHFSNPAFDPTMANMNFNPFSMSLPTESQQLLGPGLDLNDPFTSMLMQGSEPRMQQPFYSYNPNGTSKPKTFSNQFDGMNQTLAPGMLDTSFINDGSNFNTTPQSGYGDSVMSPWASNGFGYGFDPSCFTNEPTKPSLTRQNSGLNSGAVTPGADREWSSLIDGNVWEEASSQPTAAV